MPAVLVLFLASCCPSDPAKPPAAAARPDRKLTSDDRTRFLTLAVFEGLFEDGPEPEVFETILKDRDAHFVAKCPNCNCVGGAIEGYVTFSKTYIYPPLKKSFPPEIETGLKSGDRAARLKAIEALVDRYVTRRFEQSTLTPGEKEAMKSFLLMARKYGMTVKDESFGDRCPSCEGAIRK